MSETRAIIADDEEQLRIYLKSRLLEVWPDLVLCGEAVNGLEALKLIKKLKPDIAFLDIKMPGLSGMEVARRISKDNNQQSNARRFVCFSGSETVSENIWIAAITPSTGTASISVH